MNYTNNFNGLSRLLITNGYKAENEKRKHGSFVLNAWNKKLKTEEKIISNLDFKTFRFKEHLKWRAATRQICCNQKINILKPTGYVMHEQFNIQQLYALPTLYLCVLYLSENKQRLVPLTA